MEAGVYVLEDAFTLPLINMHLLKHVPGRKTDVKDSEWLAQLLECGLLSSSFVPPPAIRELRDLSAIGCNRCAIAAKKSTGCAKSWKTPA